MKERIEGITVKTTYLTSDECDFLRLDEANLWQSWLNLSEYLAKTIVDISSELIRRSPLLSDCIRHPPDSRDILPH